MPWSLVLGLSAVYAAFFVAAVRSDRARSFAFAIPIAHVVALYLDSPNQRVVSFHGFFQYAIVYEILNGHLPPRNSLLAGEPLAYPWVEHVVLAGISRVLGVSPAFACALLNVVCLGVLLFLLSRLARDFGFDRPRTTTLILLPLLGVVFAAFSAVTSLIEPWSPWRLDWRGAPLIGHFNVPTGGTLGIVFFVVLLRALLSALAGKPASAATFAAALGVGIFYPPMFPGVLASFVMFAAVFVARRGTDRAAEIVPPFVAVLAATAIVMPYLVRVTASMEDSIRPGFHRELAPFVGAVAQVLLATLPVAALVWLLRRPWREAFAEHEDALVLLLAVLGGLAAAFAVTHYQGFGQYKLAILMNLVLAIVAAPAVASLALSWPAIAFVVAWVFFIPVGVEVQVMYSAWQRVDYPWVEEGTEILPAGRPERELYAWIRKNTRSSEAFVDTQLTLPTFAGRPLWVGLDAQTKFGGRLWKDGWLMSARALEVEMLGASPQLFDCRARLARAIYTPEEDVDASLAALARAAPESGLWILARRGAMRHRLSASPLLTSAFVNKAAQVFHLSRDPSGPDECRAES